VPFLRHLLQPPELESDELDPPGLTQRFSTYTSHASIAIRLDCYGHLMPGNEDGAAGHDGTRPAGFVGATLICTRERSDSARRAGRSR